MNQPAPAVALLRLEITLSFLGNVALSLLIFVLYLPFGLASCLVTWSLRMLPATGWMM